MSKGQRKRVREPTRKEVQELNTHIGTKRCQNPPPRIHHLRIPSTQLKLPSSRHCMRHHITLLSSCPIIPRRPILRVPLGFLSNGADEASGCRGDGDAFLMNGIKLLVMRGVGGKDTSELRVCISLVRGDPVISLAVSIPISIPIPIPISDHVDVEVRVEVVGRRMKDRFAFPIKDPNMARGIRKAQREDIHLAGGVGIAGQRSVNFLHR